MSAAILDIRSLTVRFGGLFAVRRLDLRVETGSIAAVIGPNGAGKTTVFNALTGMVDPAEGQIHFDNARLARAFTRRLALAWIAIGLACGTFLLVFTSDVDRMWTVAVKQNFRDPKGGFSVSDAARDAFAHIAAKFGVEERGPKRVFVISHDGYPLVGPLETLEEGIRERNVIEEFRGRDFLDRRIESDGTNFVIFAPERYARVVLGTDISTAIERAQKIEAELRESNGVRLTRTMIFAIGTVIGILGAATVFRQTRRATSWIARRHIARTFQNIRLFKGMTVLENVMVAVPEAVGKAGTRGPMTRSPSGAMLAAVPLALLVLLGAYRRIPRGARRDRRRAARDVPARLCRVAAASRADRRVQPARARRRGRHRRARDGGTAFHGARGTRGRTRVEPRIRRAATARNRARPRHRAQADSAR